MTDPVFMDGLTMHDLAADVAGVIESENGFGAAKMVRRRQRIGDTN